MIDESVVNLSRLQFAITALYHFIFVPLTLGLAFIMAIMESVYVMTKNEIYKDMTKFWGKLFAINFAMGVATGITLEFQFGTNWAYYAHYVGDVFGVPLAIEGMMAFFLESTLIGVFFFGWDRISKVQHLAVTWLIAFGANLSALWILIANAWMQNPVGTEFNYTTMRMELQSLSDVFFNPVAQVKFVHTVAAGYVTGAMFVLGISSYYILKQRDLAFAKRSFAVASAFGLASVLSVLVLGDESGYSVGQVQKTKLAAIEAEWDTQPAPAPLTLIGFPDDATQTTKYAIKIPYVLGLIATRSTTEVIPGIKQIVADSKDKIRNGILAYGMLQRLRNGDKSPELQSDFERLRPFLGYGLLLKRFIADPTKATEADIEKAAQSVVPKSAPLFWSFRIMVGCGILMLFIFIAAFYYNAKRNIVYKPWLLKLALFGIPLPWIASECGWIVAEYGRQPWAIGEILPTFLATSSVSVNQVLISLGGFILLYSALLGVELYLMFKYARLGPSSLGTGRYHFEVQQ
jgi:cytochrome d ubiquinol oxidase subunit I